MLALVKKPHTELSISGKGAAEILDLIRSRYNVQIISSSKVEDESVLINDTDWWKSSGKNRVLAGARIRKGITQKRLAELTGIRQSVISEYESGKRKMTQKAAAKFAEVLDTYPEKFLS